MFQKAIKKTLNNNIEIISLWCLLLIAKFIVWPKIVVLSLILSGFVMMVTVVKYVELKPKFMWLLPTFIIVFFQIIIIIDLIRHYQINNKLLCICLVIFRDMFFKDATLIFFNLISVAITYTDIDHLSDLIIPTINLLFIIVTIIIKRQNIWLEIAKNYHLELITYITKIVPELCSNVMTSIFQKQTYVDLYDQLKLFMSEPSNLPKHIESLKNLELTLCDTAELNKCITPTNDILLCLSPIACVPTLFVFLFNWEPIFILLSLCELIKFIYRYTNGVTLMELVYGSLFVQTIGIINSGIDLSIKAVKVTKQSLDSYLITTEYVNGVITDVSTKVNYIGNQITEKATKVRDLGSSGIEYTKQHPYLATAVLGLGVIGCMALAKR